MGTINIENETWKNRGNVRKVGEEEKKETSQKRSWAFTLEENNYAYDSVLVHLMFDKRASKQLARLLTKQQQQYLY